MRFTGRQADAIRAETHLLMEAGAGSGKTSTLVGKLMHALGAEVLPGERAERACELDGIVAITFTEAAAADLKAALRRAVRAEAKRTGDPVWRRRLYALERARIGTIHSFCGVLLREWGERIGVDPGFRILDETESSLLRREVAHVALLAALGDGDEILTDLVAELGAGDALGAIERAMGNAAVARAALARWCPGGEPRTTELRAMAEAAGLTWQPHDDRALRCAARLLRLAATARRRFDERLARDGALDFDGLIEHTRKLVLERDDVVQRLRGRMRWLFIDEFQDTDRAQKQIAYRICGLDGPVSGEAPRLCIVGDPKQSIYRFRSADVSVWNEVAADFEARGLPVVPLDVNFRSRAPLLGYVNATFAPLMDGRPAPGGDVRHEVLYAPLRPSRDFAGDDGLLEILPVGAKDGEKMNAPERRRAEAELVARRLRALVAGERCIREQDREGNESRRAPQWKDVALLFRSRTAVPIYEEALRRHGIPYYVSSGSGFFARREVRDLVLLLRALADARDDIAWAGVLRSPWVGLSDEALLRMRRAAASRPLSELLGCALPGADGERLEHAAGWLRELRPLRDRVRPAVLVERALERSGYAEHVLLMDGGELALANLRKLVRMAEQGAGASLVELVEWLAQREEIATREPEARLHTAGENVVVLTTVHASKGLEWPVVFLCDLERELVRGPGHRAALLFDEEAGIGLKLQDRNQKNAPATAAWERLAVRDRALDLAEEKRIWYVAATRARDRLVLAGCVLEQSAPDGATEDEPCRAAQWLLSALLVDSSRVGYAVEGEQWSGAVLREVAGDAPAREPVAPPTLADLVDAPPLQGAAGLRFGALPPIRARRRHSATELMNFDRDRDEHRRTYRLGLPARRFRGEAAEGDPAQALSPRAVGNIVHGVLEKLREETDLDSLLDAEIGAEIGEIAASTLPDQTRLHLRLLLEETRTHPALAPLFASGSAEPELPFTWLLSDAGTPIALHGAMDLVAMVDGVPEIVDFKTHTIEPGEEDEVGRRYAIQSQAYAAALADLLGTTPGAMRFFFPATRGESRTPLDEPWLEEARQRIRTLVGRIHEG